jgi:hypothetical protein
MKLNVYIGKNKEYKIEYNLYDNPTVKLIYDRLASIDAVINHRQVNGFRDVSVIQSDLENIVAKLNSLKISIEYTPEDLNKLHTNFPENLHRHKHDKDLWQALSLFNDLIHELEVTEKGITKIWALHGVDEGEPLLEDSYSMFEIPEQGKLYMNYPHVGKHFLELFLDQDVDCPEEQIVLTHNYNASLVQFFSDHTFLFKDLEPHMKDFYDKVEDKMKYPWGDQRLAIGYLPIGDMINDVDEVVSNIQKYGYINSWETV